MRLPFVLFLFLLAAGCDSRESQPRADAQPQLEQIAGGALDRSQAGTSAPDVEFLDPAGERVSFADFAGKPLLVNLWATWCAPCVAEMPMLDALAGRDGNLQVLAVSQDVAGQEAKVASFFEERKLAALEAYRDPEIGLMTSLGASVLPTTILYDSSGREVWRMTGAADWTGSEAAKLIAEAR